MAAMGPVRQLVSWQEAVQASGGANAVKPYQ
jgi:hypothetical protein